MSRLKADPQQFVKTQLLLREIHAFSGVTWVALFSIIDAEIPGVVSCAAHLRQLANLHRCLSDQNLTKLAKWALLKNWGGDQARAAVAYIAPTKEELDEIEREYRHDQYLYANPGKRIIYGPMKEVAREKIRVAAALDAALSKLAPAGFSHADVLYMVNSWLIKNPPTVERGERQRPIVLFQYPDSANSLRSPVFPESLPNNFSMPEHQDGTPCFIDCVISRPYANCKFIPADSETE